MSKTRQDGECLVYTGYCTDQGYGSVYIGITEDGKQVWRKAHRIVWTHHHGAPPDGMLVCHTCDNPPCVNIAHLFLGTPQDNMTDKVNKGRWRNGYSDNTACPQGHPYTEENTYIKPNGRRVCRPCRDERNRRYYQSHH